MDSFFGIGVMELAFIAILALIVLGPERLPGAARETAKFFGQIRALSSEFTSQFSEELQMLDEINPKKLADDIVKETMKPPKKKATAQKPASVTPPSDVERTDAKANAEPTDADGMSSSAETQAAASSQVDDDAPSVPAEPENRIMPPAHGEVVPRETASNGAHAAPVAATGAAADRAANSSSAEPAAEIPLSRSDTDLATSSPPQPEDEDEAGGGERAA